VKISPSQIVSYRRCKRRIGFEYVEGLRSPPSSKQQFGLDVHTQLENWLKGGTVPDDSPAGLTAKQGINRWLPAPNNALLIEHKWEIPLEHGISLGGIADCVVPPQGDESPIVIDHKTTSNLQYALTPEQLAVDVQALLYATWAGLKYNAREVRARWIYYCASNPKSGKRKPAGTLPAETVIVLPEAVGLMRKVLEDVEEIAMIRQRQIKGMALKPSPEGCAMYGGCFHKERCNDLTMEDRIASKMNAKY